MADEKSDANDDKNLTSPLDDLEKSLAEGMAQAPNAATRVAIALRSVALLATGTMTNSMNVKDGPKKKEYADRYDELSRRAAGHVVDALTALIDERVTLALEKSK